MALVPVEAGQLASISNFGLGAPKQRARDFQRTTELICKFIVDTTQLLNRLGAHCDEKLQRVSRDLQRFEVQLRLLEYKLDSIDEEEGRMAQGAEDRKTQREDAKAKREEAQEEAVAAREAAREAKLEQRAAGGGGGAGVGAPPGTRLAIGAPPGTAGASGVPQMPGKGRYAPGNVPLPGQAGGAGGAVPLPPGVSAGAGAAPNVGPAPPPPPMTKIVAAPPMMPQAAGLTCRKHPKLKGYFEMLAAGVPAQAIKTRMQNDGHKPEWLDTPDFQSPLPAMSEAQKKTFYDSD